MRQPLLSVLFVNAEEALPAGAGEAIPEIAAFSDRGLA